MRYILIRHPESMQNIEEKLSVLDPLVGYSDNGKKQAETLVKRIIETVGESKEVGVYYSPYFRTRSVANKLNAIVPYWNYVEESLISEI